MEELAVIDNETGEILKPAKRINLHDYEAVNREMKTVYRDIKNGLIDSTEGYKRVMILREILKAEETKRTKLPPPVITTKGKNQTEDEFLKELHDREMLKYSVSTSDEPTDEEVLKEFYAQLTPEQVKQYEEAVRMIKRFAESEEGKIYRKKADVNALNRYCKRIRIRALKEELESLEGSSIH